MTHFELIVSTSRRIREAGPAVALDEIRAAAGDRHHHTRAVFFVWAVERLQAAGLGDIAIGWHPLTDPRSPLAWYDADTLDSIEARTSFVAPTLALPGEPAPTEPRTLVAAA